MTYDKETRNELMNDEIVEDKIREHSNEVDSGDFDSWIGDNKDELIAEFIDEYNIIWKDFCKDKWREENE